MGLKGRDSLLHYSNFRFVFHSVVKAPPYQGNDRPHNKLPSVSDI
jgi:hypothetical protein